MQYAKNRWHMAGVIALLTSAIYMLLGLIQQFGETDFYNPLEHLMFLLYGASSYLSCRFCLLYLGTPKLHFGTLLQLSLFSSLLNAALSTLLFLLVRFVLHNNDWLPSALGLLANLIYTFLTLHLPLLALYLTYLLMQQSHQSSMQQLAAERESAQARFQLLQQQITPHFLFNSLNVLTALIDAEPKLAQRYVTLFSALYRFVLKHKDEERIPLTQELEFIKQYLELMNIRFNDSYQLQLFTLPANITELWVAPGALQACVENAVKHNQANHLQPLLIDIRLQQNGLLIENRIRPRPTDVESTGTGLDNLRRRYLALSGQAVVVQQNQDSFSVWLPLLAAPEDQS